MKLRHTNTNVILINFNFSDHFRLSTYKGRLAKPANKYLRWNLLFTFFILLFITSPIWVPLIPKMCTICMEIVLTVLTTLHFLWFVALVNNIRYLVRLRRYARHRIDLKKVFDNWCKEDAN
jgi:hypothetical protein